jgi:protein-S-isoprenylcysteine O-methyltransferase Ste14
VRQIVAVTNAVRRETSDAVGSLPPSGSSDPLILLLRCGYPDGLSDTMSPVAFASLLAVAAIVCFAWSVFGVFRSGESTTSGYVTLKWTVVTTWAIQVYRLLEADLSFDSARYWIGNLMVAIALLLFWHCVRVTRARKLSLAFSKDTPEHLYSVGAYGYVRHPFYLSYLLAYYGIALTAHDILLYLAAVAMTVLYYEAARFEERKFEGSNLAPHYAKYRRCAGMFLPRVRRPADRCD